MASANDSDLPKTCKAGVVDNEGPDFKLTVEDVPVPSPGKHIYIFLAYDVSVDLVSRTR
jgi:hypothetical protein